MSSSVVTSSTEQSKVTLSTPPQESTLVTTTEGVTTNKHNTINRTDYYDINNSPGIYIGDYHTIYHRGSNKKSVTPSTEQTNMISTTPLESTLVTTKASPIEGEYTLVTTTEGVTTYKQLSQNIISTTATISGTAVVHSRLGFNSSSPVPSESLVLSVAGTLLNSRSPNLTSSTKVLNITYEKKTDAFYVVIFTFSLSNVSMPESPDLRNSTYIQVQNSITTALNTLLNEPYAEPFEPKSSVFTTSANQVEGSMEYSFQDGDKHTPISFLSNLQTQTAASTTVSPATTTKLLETSSTTSSKISGTAVVHSRLGFNSSSPVPSESLVLSVAGTLLNSRSPNLTSSTKVLNITYEKKTDAFYVVIFTFSLSNVSMPESPDLRNSTYIQVQNSITTALNTLLNEPDAEPFEPKSSVFTTSANQVEGSMEYSFQDGDKHTPISFLSNLQTQTAASTTVSPATTTKLLETSSTTSSKISGTAVVHSRLGFNSSSPVPSESLVLSVAGTLLNSRSPNLTSSTKVLNITYEKKTDAFYVVIFTFSLSNVSMPESPDLRNSTYIQVQNSITTALNTLLNEPDAEPFEPKSSVFTTSANQVEGSMEYSFQDGDKHTPISFLSNLQTQTAASTTVSPATTTKLLETSSTTSSKISGTAVVHGRLGFNSSSPVPSESLVLSVAGTLLNSRSPNLTSSTKVLNITYEKKTDAFYVVIFTFSLSNVSMPESPDLRNSTYIQVQNSITTAVSPYYHLSYSSESQSPCRENPLNTLLNEPDAEPFEPKSSVFTSGTAVVHSRLGFNSSSPVPSESLVLSVAGTLLNSRSPNLTSSTKVLNITYEKKTDAFYVVIFTFSLSNVSMPESPDLRNSTYIQVQNSITTALNTLLNEPDAEPFEPKSSVFTTSANQVEGSMEYSFQDGDKHTPISFLSNLQTQTAASTTVSPATTTKLLETSSTTSSKISGTAVVHSRLGFNSSSPVPSESLVLSVAGTLLNSRSPNLTSSTKVLNITYEKKTDAFYVVIFTFSLSNVSMPESPDLRNSTYIQVQNSITTALNTLLNEPDAEPFEPKSSVFTTSANQVEGSMEYSFQDGDKHTPISFLSNLQTQTAASTTVSPATTTKLLETSSTTSSKISGTAVVHSRLGFNSSSPVPSESLVLSVAGTLLNSRSPNLTSSTKVLNITYEKKTDAFYVVIFTFSLSNVSMPESPDLRNSTYIQVQNSITTAVSPYYHLSYSSESQSPCRENPLNTLLNEPDAEPFEPKSSVFTSGTAVVHGRLGFNSSSPVPSESLVLSVAGTLLNSRSPNLTSSTKVLNITYEKKTDAFYVVIFTFSLSNVSMPESPDLRNSTYIQVQNSITTALNTLLNEPDAEPFEPKSSVFTTSANQVEGSMEYSFQDGDKHTPISFLSNLQTQTAASTTVSPATTTKLLETSSTTSSKISGTAVVHSRLGFNSSSPVPSESLVLSVAGTLLNSRSPNLTSSTKVLNITYEKKTDAFYVVIFTFSLSNVSMPESPDHRNSTYIQVQNSITTAVSPYYHLSYSSESQSPCRENPLNTLLNEPDAEPFKPKSSVFTTSANQVEGSMEYSFQDGDKHTPISFLSNLQTQTAASTTVSPATTTKLLETSSTTSSKISGTAVVHGRLGFNSSSPVPSESLVLSVAGTLLNSRSPNLTSSTKVLNITYEKKTDAFYVVIFTFSLSNVSMPESPDLRNSTYIQVQNSITTALNTLLNEPDAEPFEPKSSVFTTSANQVEGSMEYSFQDGDKHTPISFLSNLQTQTAASTTVSPATTTKLLETSSTTSSKISGTAVVHSRLGFNSSSPVPSESLVLSVAGTLLNSRSPNLTSSTKVLNITYEKKTDAFYVVIFTFSLSNVSMPESPDLRNSTYIQVQNSITTAVSPYYHLSYSSESQSPCRENPLNTLLNEPDAEPFEPKSSVFTTSANQVEGSMEYSFQDGDKHTPISFLSNLQTQTAASTTVSPATTTKLLETSSTTSSKISGTAVVHSRLGFNSSSPVPSESLVLSVAGTLLNSRSPNLTSSTKVLNITYEKKTDAFYVVIFTFSLSNVSMPESPDLRNSTYIQVQNSITTALNTLLNEPDAEPFEPKSSVFTTSANQVEGSMEYSFQDGDKHTPISFLSNLQTQTAASTTVSPATTTKLLETSSTTSSKISGTAVVHSRLGFNSSSPVPSESLVLSVAGTLLNSRSPNLTSSTKVLNITYEKKTDAFYVVIFTFSLSNVSMPESPDLRNSTYIQVQNSITTAVSPYYHLSYSSESQSPFRENPLNTLLNEPDAEPFEPKSSVFTTSANQVEGSMEYSFQDGDKHTPISFLSNLQTQTAASTTVSPATTTKLLETSSTTSSKISGTAVVHSRLGFNSSSPVPSESLVLSVAGTLLNSRSPNLTSSTKVLNITYEKKTDAFYVVIFTFSLSNVSMPESPDLRNSTYIQVQNSITTALNTLLNEPDAEPFEPKSSVFTTSANQVEGSMEYSFQDGDKHTPISFLSNLQTQTAASTTVSPATTTKLLETSSTTSSKISGTAVVHSRLGFNSSSPVPSESLVLSVAGTLLNSRSPNLTSSTKVLNITYEKKTDAFYVVIFTFSLSNVSMPESPDLRNSTYIQVQNSITTAVSPYYHLSYSSESQSPCRENPLNTLLNEPDAEPFEPKSSVFTSGTAVVHSRLGFNSSSPVPSESLVLSVAGTLLNSRSPNLTSSTKVLNITYEKKTDAFYVVIFTFSLSNVSMPESPDLRNSTYIQVQNSITTALNTLLNEPDAEPFEPKSSVFTTSANQVEGSMEYSFQDGDKHTPISFLSNLQTQTAASTTVSPATTTKLLETSSTTSSKISGTAVVHSRLGFNSSSPVPSESLVLSVAGTLLNSRSPNLTSSTKVLNITYEKKTDAFYVVIFTFSLSNVSMPESPDLRNSTYIQVQNSITTAVSPYYHLSYSSESQSPCRENPLNTLLNEPDAEPFEPKSSVFTSGTAVVHSRLGFNSSSPVPSESLVLSVAGTLLNSRSPNLTSSTKVLNITYEKKTDAFYVVIFTFSLSNVSMPESPDLRNSTYIQVQNSITTALNTLLNEPDAEPFEPKSSVFTTSANQVEGSMEYSFQDGDKHTPISFLSNLQTQTAASTTVSPATTTKLLETSSTTSSKISGTAVVHSRLGFNSSSPVPSESLVLSVAGTLLNSRSPNLTSSTKVLNITYEKKTDAFYVVIFTFSLSNVSMPESPDLRNSTYIQVQNSITTAVSPYYHLSYSSESQSPCRENPLNTLLNEPDAEPFEPKSSVFTTSANQVEGSMEYGFQDGDKHTPISFLSNLQTQTAASTTVSPATTTKLLETSSTTSSKISGTAVVHSRLGFNSSSPVPSESLVLSVAGTLLNSRSPNLTSSTKVLNITYEKISDTSFVVIFTFSVSNVSMPESPDLRNSTYIHVQNSINAALNTILNDPSIDNFIPQTTSFTGTSDQILGDVLYSFQEGDIKKPTSFLSLIANGMSATTTLETSTAPSLLGTVLIYIHLVFKNVTILPTEADILKAANSLLDSSIRMRQNIRMQKLNNPVSIQNITFQKTGNNSYRISFGFKISNVNMSPDTQMRNETYIAIQNTVNSLLNKILNSKNASQFVFPVANYTGNYTVIQADSEYVFVEGDIKTPSGFLEEILKVSGLASTTPQPTVLSTTVQATPHTNSTGGGFPGWALAIIIPCGIAIILVPLWIIIGCMLCGCCAAIRRRYSRRRSYNVQYTTRNGLF
ncbi:uncharacterized protein [Salminus brasiliensis]|uniref:uncharacterized protein n=1 Tax=Salminus brasiliensis TaxID=930266 RepID=UPI003B82EE70